MAAPEQGTPGAAVAAGPADTAEALSGTAGAENFTSDAGQGPPRSEGASPTGVGGKRPRVEPDSGRAASCLTEEEFTCSICWDLLLDPVVSQCGHEFCDHCLQRWLKEQGKRSCPTCRQRLPPGSPAICRVLQRTLAALFPKRLQQRQAEAAEQLAAMREQEAQAPVAAPSNPREQRISAADSPGTAEHSELLRQQERLQRTASDADFAASFNSMLVRLFEGTPLEGLAGGERFVPGPARDPLLGVSQQYEPGRAGSFTGALRSNLDMAPPLPPPTTEWFSPVLHATPLRPEPQLLSRRHPQQGLDRVDTPLPPAWPSGPPLELMRFTEGWSGRALQPPQHLLLPLSLPTDFAGLATPSNPLPLRPEPQLLSRNNSQEGLDIGGTAVPPAWPSAPPLELMRFTEGRQEAEPRRRRKRRTSHRSPS